MLRAETGLYGCLTLITTTWGSSSLGCRQKNPIRVSQNDVHHFCEHCNTDSLSLCGASRTLDPCREDRTPNTAESSHRLVWACPGLGKALVDTVVFDVDLLKFAIRL